MTPDYSELPVASVTELANYLEAETADQNRTPELTNKPDLIVDTPEIEQAMRSRGARFLLIQDLLDFGHAVEQRDGKISILRSDAYKKATDRRERDRHAMIVISENRDRIAIYDSLQKTNALSSASRSAIEEIFADARYALLEPGQKYKSNDGEVLVK
jgi:hypothetical protein